MSFLRRVFGGGAGHRGGSPAGAAPDAAGATGDVAEREEVERDEAERDRVLLREDSERLSDELIARQVRYADRRWTPPAQGGTRRAGDSDAAADDRD